MRPLSSLHVSLEATDCKAASERKDTVAKAYHVVRIRNSGATPSYEIKDTVDPDTDVELGQLTVSEGILRIDGLLDSFALVSGASRKLSGIYDGERGNSLINGQALGSLQGPPNLSFTLANSSNNTEVQVDSSLRSEYGGGNVGSSSLQGEQPNVLALNLTETSLPLEENLRHHDSSQPGRVATPKPSRDLVQDTPATGARFKDLFAVDQRAGDNDLEDQEELDLPHFSQSAAANQRYAESMPSIMQLVGDNTEGGPSYDSNSMRFTPANNSQTDPPSLLSSHVPQEAEQYNVTRGISAAQFEVQAAPAVSMKQSPSRSSIMTAKLPASSEGQENFSTPLEDGIEAEDQPQILLDKTDVDPDEAESKLSSPSTTSSGAEAPEAPDPQDAEPGALEPDGLDKDLPEPEPQERGRKRKNAEPPLASFSPPQSSGEAPPSPKRRRSSQSATYKPLQNTAVKLKTYGKSKTSPKAAKSSQLLRDPPAMVFSNSTVPETSKSMKFLKKSGALVVKTIEGNNFDILVVGKGELKKTPKLLMAIALGKPIVTDDWIKSCIEEDGFLAPVEFTARDTKREQEWGYDPADRCDRTRLLESRTVYVTPALKKVWGTGYRDIKALAEVMGATKVVSRPVTGKDSDADGTIFLGTENDDDDCLTLLQRGSAVYSRDLLPFAVLRGGLDLDDEEFAIVIGDGEGSVPAKGKKKAPSAKKRGRPRRNA